MQECFCYPNFFNSSDLDYINQVVASSGPGRDRRVNGTFPDELIANYVNLRDNIVFVDWMHNKIKSVFDRNFVFSALNRVILYKPWDVHSDFFVDQCLPGYQPYYNCLISLDDVPSRTIVFEQYTDGPNDFCTYKQTHSQIPNPVDKQFWDDNLDFCWEQDRAYLSIKQVMPYQSKGQFQGFPRKYFHSSDNFHHRISNSKSFIHLRLDTTDV